MLREAVECTPQQEALVCEGERLSYEEYWRCVCGLAADLEGCGVRGGRVAIALNNSIDLCVAVFAVQAAGAQCAIVNPAFTAHELGPILADIDAAVLIYDAASDAVLRPLARRLGLSSRIMVENATGFRLTKWRRDWPVAAVGPEPEPESLGLLLYTGGTTGQSKGVNITHSASAHGIAQMNSLVPATAGKERLLCAVPMYHIYALMVCLMNMVYNCGTLIILPRYSASGVVDALASEAITMIAGGPTMFTALLQSDEFSNAKFPALKCSYSGGAALPEETLRRWERATGAPVVEGYGQTETGGGITFNPLEGVRKPGSAGLPVVGAEVQIVDIETGTRVLPSGENGEIRVRGPMIMRDYRGLPEETAAVLRQGWLYTTDIGRLDEDGYLYISDRKKDLVVVSGFNVYPREVEEVLYLNPYVTEAAVIGVADPYQGEALQAYVVLCEAGALDAAAIEAHCRAHLVAYKVPRRIVFSTALPKTPVGKVDKRRLCVESSD